MKKNLFLLFMLFISIAGSAQTFTIVNNSKTVLYFQIGGSDKSSCNQMHNSMVIMISPSSTIVYADPSKIKWTGTNSEVLMDYTSFNCNYTDPSGACISNASEIIGSEGCHKNQKATISTTKCGLSGSNLDLLWSEKNGNVLVTVN